MLPLHATVIEVGGESSSDRDSLPARCIQICELFITNNNYMCARVCVCVCKEKYGVRKCAEPFLQIRQQVMGSLEFLPGSRPFCLVKACIWAVLFFGYRRVLQTVH